MEIKCAYDELIAIEKLKPNPKNPNKHPPKQIELLAKIIGKTGWRSPIVVSNLSGFIVRGHGRLEAAKLAGFKKVPVDYQDYINAKQEMADLVADNRIAELAEIDMPKLNMIMEDLDDGGGFDMDLTGYEWINPEKTKPSLKPMNISAPPAMTWCLVGIPSNQLHQIQDCIDKIALNKNTIVEMGVGN